MSPALESLPRPSPAGGARRPRGARLLLAPLALGLLLPVGVALLWELAARPGWIEARLLPPPSGGRHLGRAAGERRSPRPRRGHLGRVAAGFALGPGARRRCWAPSPAFPPACASLDPTLQALRAIPSIAWVPLFILWFGIFEASKVALIATGAFFPVYLALMTGIQASTASWSRSAGSTSSVPWR